MQNNVLTSEEVKEIIDNLYTTIGVRMNVNLSKYPNINDFSGLNQSSFLDDCKVIMVHLELPIRINPLFSSAFETRGIVRNEGNGTSGIGAQIHIPGNLPWYKTEAMNNYPINITVPPEAFSNGHYYLMTQLSHEFSHIYLYSRRDPQRESEWATDLCALMMGFTPLWLQGRKHTSKQVSSTQTITYIQTQGYLSDTEFNFAVNYINKLRSPFEQLRNSLSSLKQKIQSDCNDITKYLEDVRLLHDFHFKHPQKSFKHLEDAAVFSKLAQSQYESEIAALLTKSKSDTNGIVRLLQDKKEFYENDKKWMENSLEKLNAIEVELGHRLNELKHDYEVIFQNIDVKHYTRIFNARVKSMSEGLRKAKKSIQMIFQEMEILEQCLAYYKRYKKQSYAVETDAKTFSLISHTDYKTGSENFVKEKQEKIDEIDSVLRDAHYFYSIDDDILVSQLAELNDVVSTLSYCLNEQKSHIKVVKRNLTFLGKIKWFLRSIFTSQPAGINS